jgi:hypothetical protein
MACGLVLSQEQYVYPNPVNHTPPVLSTPVEHGHHGTHFVKITTISHCNGIMVDKAKDKSCATNAQFSRFQMKQPDFTLEFAESAGFILL